MFNLFQPNYFGQVAPHFLSLTQQTRFVARFLAIVALLPFLGLMTDVTHSDDELLTDELLTDELLTDELLIDDDDLLVDDLDDLLLDDGDLSAEDNPPDPTTEQSNVAAEAAQQHEALFAETRFPSAGTCGTCHPKHYAEWSISQHSYSQLSPVYLSLSNKINQLC